ncbi:MAG: TonB-dependent receptor [gamma proteobacterium symbiont of Lucinoma myriamae]|nr:TonB-dependent receptor [gamma proteobacterium symbiont of Lucinoma myriamae]MCU7818830.1 TonB-dependent receptor [gamma proteobacterium symbiont of Lucinoma myriamae]MCU7832022.1 TonB-dependent receptor [gamma proteobacterium symbiont of Lucinoma myriamae]
MNNRLLSAAVFAAILLPTTAMATNGMFMMGNGTKSNGRAGAGIAIADHAVSAADNPAAMVRVGNRFDFGIQMFDPDRAAVISGHAAGPGNPPNFDGTGNNDGPFYIPEGGFNYMLSDDMSVGLTVVGTGGMNKNYDNMWMYDQTDMMSPGGYPSTTGINLEQVRILPTLSYKINDKHSVGVSLQVAYQQFKAWGLSNFDNSNFSSNPGSVADKGRDDAWGFGLSLGWQGQLTDQLTVGVVYNSEIDMDEMDDYSGLLAEDGSLDVPENYGIGLAFQATDQLMLAFDVQQINYSDVKSIGNSIQSGMCSGVAPGDCMIAPGKQLGDNNGSGFGWDDMTVYKLGAEYQVNSQLTLRAGYSHADQPIDKDQTLFNILVPAVIEDHATIGMTYVLPNQSEISMFYMHAFKEKVKGSNSIPAFFGTGGAPGEADIKMSQDAFGIAYGWNF